MINEIEEEVVPGIYCYTIRWVKKWIAYRYIRILFDIILSGTRGPGRDPAPNPSTKLGEASWLVSYLFFRFLLSGTFLTATEERISTQRPVMTKGTQIVEPFVAVVTGYLEIGGLL